jgi:hypothetical protein
MLSVTMFYAGIVNSLEDKAMHYLTLTFINMERANSHSLPREECAC